ncbi:MAG: ATP-dependent DNA helicase RecQ [Planctomycetota bacterium]|nr:MAG: ATP-dependent DNA helicase RecQ [Planctomycetota bacterium]
MSAEGIEGEHDPIHEPAASEQPPVDFDENGEPIEAPDLDTALHALGYDSFRSGQREAIETLLEVGRLLLVAPTGGGKSLSYQLPASVLPGTSLVVSPLISLMHDQVSALTERGVAATFLASTLDNNELRERMRGIAEGAYQLVYVAPERLSHPGFRALLSEIECPLVAIDEAHCISEWGHDFRPEYMHIGELVSSLPRARVLACTATATPVVRDEIVERLNLPADTPQFVNGFARPNLALGVHEVRHKRERCDIVDSVLKEALGEPGGSADRKGCAIIYAPTRRTTEAEAERLQDAGWEVDAYHAGLPARNRERAQDSFLRGELDVVVATNAFGMGIDRADVRAVVHLAPPGSMEAYYQEVGRAGRDGEPAVGRLLISPGDMALRRRLIEGDGDQHDPEFVAHRWGMFLELLRWAEGGSCRHDAILRYFGDEAETLAGCGHCDVCLGLADGQAADPEEVSLLVRKALSGVARVHGRFGMALAAKLLKGTPDERLDWSGLANTSTFGVLSERKEEWIAHLLRRCLAAGWVDLSDGERPMVLLTAEGKQVMWEQRPARLLLPPEPRKGSGKGSSRSSGSRSRGSAAPAGEELLDDVAQQLFEALREHRREVARAESVPPYVVASDRTLRDIARIKPRDLEALQEAHGIGPSKAERFGEGLLAVVAEAG